MGDPSIVTQIEITGSHPQRQGRQVESVRVFTVQGAKFDSLSFVSLPGYQEQGMAAPEQRRSQFFPMAGRPVASC